MTGSVLYVYAATSDDRTLGRLSASIEAQQAIGGETLASSVLLMDRPRADLSRPMQRAFGDRLTYENPFVACTETDRAFCLSRFRNASFRVAREAGVDWLVLCDADTIIARPPVFEPGQTYRVPDVYWQRRESETIQESLETINKEGGEAFSPGNSWFIVHRSIFDSLDFNENIYGYGWEDLEFNERVWAAGHRLQPACGVVIHRYHPEKDRRINERQYARNEMIFKASKVATAAGVYSSWRDVEVIEAMHPEWRDFLWLDQSRAIAIHGRKEAIGRYTQDKNSVKITWANDITDAFIREGHALRFTHHLG